MWSGPAFPPHFLWCSQNPVCVLKGPAVVMASPWGHLLLLPFPLSFPYLSQIRRHLKEGYPGALDEWELIFLITHYENTEIRLAAGRGAKGVVLDSLGILLIAVAGTSGAGLDH